jgi:hypothetical protein
LSETLFSRRERWWNIHRSSRASSSSGSTLLRRVSTISLSPRRSHIQPLLFMHLPVSGPCKGKSLNSKANIGCLVWDRKSFSQNLAHGTPSAPSTATSYKAPPDSTRIAYFGKTAKHLSGAGQFMECTTTVNTCLSQFLQMLKRRCYRYVDGERCEKSWCFS